MTSRPEHNRRQDHHDDNTPSTPTTRHDPEHDRPPGPAIPTDRERTARDLTDWLTGFDVPGQRADEPAHPTDPGWTPPPNPPKSTTPPLPRRVPRKPPPPATSHPHTWHLPPSHLPPSHLPAHPPTACPSTPQPPSDWQPLDLLSLIPAPRPAPDNWR
ncbi:hypothetical protein [Saccharothrix yanglingensis]|uniref:Uncharacterized protein n=1 Tax=Saccharothrix yanglingensis TaxID=659496 RepID=A0ABU0WRI1_9PSEU|nr:hypothetical protein [Saccharothrix yanglingensis]MDQ2582446.1 hypothetical protein [Saccharothrix yanglingensis]